MLKKLFPALLFLSLVSQSLYSENQFEISLLTCSSGKESFSTWGHSAIRIVDKENAIDIVYNFGLFDFNTPNFHWKFIRGNLKYKLGAHDTYRFINSYILDDRQVIEQKLDLSDESKLKIISKLEYLYKPENRYYYYDFLKKNCTSELRDLIFNNIDSDFQDIQTDKSYRSQLNEFMINKPWLKAGINLVFGTKVDRKVNKYESMFLPDYLYWELNKVKVDGNELVYSEQKINELKDKTSAYPILLQPILWFTILLILVLIFNSPGLQYPILIITGLLGLLILSVWIITEHLELKNNFNLLWGNPLYLLFVYFKIKKDLKFQKYLAIVLQSMLVIFAIVWIFNIQSFEIIFGIFAIILSVYNIRAIKKSAIIDAP